MNPFLDSASTVFRVLFVQVLLIEVLD